MVIRKNAGIEEHLQSLVNRVAVPHKRWVVGTHQWNVGASHLDYHLDEL